MRLRSAVLSLMLSGSLVSCGTGSVAPQGTDRASAEAGQASDPTRMTTALAIRVFRDLCMANPTREDARQVWLQKMGFQRVSAPLASVHLSAGPGTVWLRPDPAPVGFPIVVVTRPSGIQCEVRSPVAEPDSAAQAFADAVQGIATPGLVIRKDADSQSHPAGGPGRYVAFRVGAAPIEKGGFHFAMSARPPERGRLALLMTASPAAPE